MPRGCPADRHHEVVKTQELIPSEPAGLPVAGKRRFLWKIIRKVNLSIGDAS